MRQTFFNGRFEKQHAVITNTFCHLPRIGQGTEQRLWESGIHTWKDFLTADSVPRISHTKKPYFDRQLKSAQRALMSGDSNFFSQLPRTEHWRLWEEFKDEAMFVDIETNFRQDITVIGIYDGDNVHHFVRHHNLDMRKVKIILNQAKLLVTFNGSCFDFPVMNNFTPRTVPDIPHIDLRFAAARVGLTGGLKQVEKDIGLARSAETQDLSGFEALKLWSAYRNTGKEIFRDLLLQYNEEDIVNLKPLAQEVYSRLESQTQQFLKTPAFVK